MSLGFDALGHHIEVEAGCHGGNGSHNLAAFGPLVQVHDEGTVNFERPHRVLVNVAEGGIACTKIVEAEAKPHLAEGL